MKLLRYCRLLLIRYCTNCTFSFLVSVVLGEQARKCQFLPRKFFLITFFLRTNLHPSLPGGKTINGFFSKLQFKLTVNIWAGLPAPLPPFSPTQWAEADSQSTRPSCPSPSLLAVGKLASICCFSFFFFFAFRQKIKLAKIFPSGSQEVLFKFSQGAAQQSQNFPAEYFVFA